MNCKKCNRSVPDDSEFCPFCGSKIEKEEVCLNCGQVLPQDSLFCPFCGTKRITENKTHSDIKAEIKPESNKCFHLERIPDEKKIEYILANSPFFNPASKSAENNEVPQPKDNNETPQPKEEKKNTAKKKAIIIIPSLLILVLLALFLYPKVANNSKTSDSDHSAELVEKSSSQKQNESVKGLEGIAYSDSTGNSIENYSNTSKLVDCGEWIFHSFTENDEIVMYNTITGESTSIGASGHSLSVFNNVLYYVQTGGEYVGSYDLKTGKLTRNIFSQYSIADGITDNIDMIDGLFVTKHGLSVIYYRSLITDSAILQLGFDNKVKKVIRLGPVGRIVLADENTIVGEDYEKNNLVIIPLSELEKKEIPLDFDLGYISASRDGNIYITNDKIGSGNIIRYSVSTGEQKEIILSAPYSTFVFDNHLYYPSFNGTNVMDLSDNTIQQLSNEFQLYNICVTENNKLYGITDYDGIDPSEAAYVKMDLDGSNVEYLKKKG